jgi:phenylacetate-CoA ligase
VNRDPTTLSWLNRLYVSVVCPIVSGNDYRGLRKRLAHLQVLERMSAADNEGLQWRAVSRILRHAYNSTPFYRKRFDKLNLKPSDIRSSMDFQNIPILRRQDIRENFDELWSREYQKEELVEAATGGTTDTPVPLLRSRECLQDRLAVRFHFDSWAGMRPGDKVFRLWGAQQDFSPNPSWRWKIYDRYLMRNIWAPTSLFNLDILESHRKLLNEFGPKIIYAYPTPLTLFCDYLRHCGRPYHRPISAICTAEPLLEQQRTIIEETLGCSVFEHYGTRDFGMVGAECEAHEGMHLNPLAVFVEFVPVEGTEIDGLQEILVTDLLNFGMPMIRYRINDCAFRASKACRCGRGFPLIQNIVGRTTDNFYLPSGGVVPGIALTNRVMQACPGLIKTQIIQESLSAFRVRYVPDPSFSSNDLRLLHKNLRRFLPETLTWTFERVDDIPRERSGKTRFCISRISDNHQTAS